MDSILKHLYEGELYPEEKIVSTDPKYHSLVREINEEQNYLYELLDETDGRRLEHLGKLYLEENAMDCYAGFAYGFRLGARMMCEIFAKENH